MLGLVGSWAVCLCSRPLTHESICLAVLWSATVTQAWLIASLCYMTRYHLESPTPQSVAKLTYQLSLLTKSELQRLQSQHPSAAVCTFHTLPCLLALWPALFCKDLGERSSPGNARFTQSSGSFRICSLVRCQGPCIYYLFIFTGMGQRWDKEPVIASLKVS